MFHHFGVDFSNEEDLLTWLLGGKIAELRFDHFSMAGISERLNKGREFFGHLLDEKLDCVDYKALSYEHEEIILEHVNQCKTVLDIAVELGHHLTASKRARTEIIKDFTIGYEELLILQKTRINRNRDGKATMSKYGLYDFPQEEGGKDALIAMSRLLLSPEYSVPDDPWEVCAHLTCYFYILIQSASLSFRLFKPQHPLFHRVNRIGWMLVNKAVEIIIDNAIKGSRKDSAVPGSRVKQGKKIAKLEIMKRAYEELCKKITMGKMKKNFVSRGDLFKAIKNEGKKLEGWAQKFPPSKTGDDKKNGYDKNTFNFFYKNFKKYKLHLSAPPDTNIADLFKEQS